MRIQNILVVSSLLTACTAREDVPASPDAPGQTDETAYPGRPNGPETNPGASVYVDATTGDDANDGSAGAPWRTITKAITNAPGMMPLDIHVAPGTYADGETFPITPRANQHLIGDLANRGEGSTPTRITGKGNFACAGGDLNGFEIPVTIGLDDKAANSSIRGFSVSGGSETVWLCNAKTTFANNTVAGSTDISVLIGFGSDVTLTDNTIENGAYSLLVHDLGTRVLARGNTFGVPTHESVVLGLTSPFTGENVDLGTTKSPGGNTFTGSPAGVGLFFQNTTSSVVSAVGNTWRPNVQGATESGSYASQMITTTVHEISGQNYATQMSPGGGLQL